MDSIICGAQSVKTASFYNQLVKINPNNMKFAILIAIIISCIATIAAEDGLLLTSKYTIQPYTKSVAFGNPCKISAGVDPKLVEELNKHASDVIHGRPITCVSPLAHNYGKCALRYKKLLIILDSLSSINFRTRRDAMGWLQENVNMLVEIAEAAASIFVKGISTNPLVSLGLDAAKQLLDQIVSTSKQSYVNQTILPVDFIKNELSDVSIVAPQRPSQLADVTHEEPYEDYWLEFMEDRMNAGLVLLKSIRAYLMRGKMDTQALGELIEDPRLINIDPEDTKIISVQVVEQELEDHLSDIKRVVFRFEEVRESSLLKRIKWGTVIAIIVSFGILSGFAVFIYQNSKTTTALINNLSVRHNNDDTAMRHISNTTSTTNLTTKNRIKDTLPIQQSQDFNQMEIESLINAPPPLMDNGQASIQPYGSRPASIKTFR